MTRSHATHARRGDFLAILADPDLLQLWLVACPDAVIVASAEDRIALYTGAAEEMFGFAPVEVLGRRLSLLFPDRAARRALRDALDRDSSVRAMELPAIRKGLPPFPAAVSAARLSNRYAERLGTVYYIRDHSAVREIEDALRRNNAQLSHLVARLDHLARHDPLTRLLTRAAAFQAAQDLLLALPRGAALGVAVFDLDHFKAVNDSYGHLAGDAVLASFGTILRQLARPGDVIGRFGGEEFVAFLPGASLDDTARFAERIRAAVPACPVAIDETIRVTVTVSAGVAALPCCATQLEEAVRIADRRLYLAKRTGRNRVVVHEPDQPTERSAA
jgi:diguanylate cyclase (GGDEF)-like protein/PAS domain S-box-containing protein